MRQKGRRNGTLRVVGHESEEATGGAKVGRQGLSLRGQQDACSHRKV